MKYIACKTLIAALMTLVFIPSVYADTSSRFTVQKINVTPLGSVATSARFQAVDTIAFVSGARTTSTSFTEDAGFAAELAPAPFEETTPPVDPPVDPPCANCGGGGGGRRAPIAVRILPGARTFGDNGIHVSFYVNRSIARIYYTTDGSDPHNGTLISQGGSIFLTDDTTVRAIAKLNDLWSPLTSEFFDYLSHEAPSEPPITPEPPVTPPQPPVITPEASEDSIPSLLVTSVATPFRQGSVLHGAAFDLEEEGPEYWPYHGAACSPPGNTFSDWTSLFWMIAFLIMTVAYINEKDICCLRHGHRRNSRWHHKRKAL